MFNVGRIHHGKNFQLGQYVFVDPMSRIHVGDNVKIDSFTILKGEIEMGDHVHIGHYNHLSGHEKIKIGSYTSISSRTTIFTDSDLFEGQSLHGPTVQKELRVAARGPVLLSDHTLIGYNSLVLPSVTTGMGCIFKAYSLLKEGYYPKHGIYQGIPAKLVKYYDPTIMIENRIKQNQLDQP